MPAKKVKSKKGYKVEGKSIQQLMRLRPTTIEKMSQKDLARVVTRLSSAANKRVRRIEAKGISTPATRQAERSGGKFSAKGKNLNELRSEYKRVKTFLKSETSTLTGYKKFSKRFEQKLQKTRTKKQKQAKKNREKLPEAPTMPPDASTPPPDESEQSASEQQNEAYSYYDKYDKVFRIVDRLRELNPWINESLASYLVVVVTEYVSQNPDIDIDEAVKAWNKTLGDWYEKQQERDSNIKWKKVF